MDVGFLDEGDLAVVEMECAKDLLDLGFRFTGEDELPGHENLHFRHFIGEDDPFGRFGRVDVRPDFRMGFIEEGGGRNVRRLKLPEVTDCPFQCFPRVGNVIHEEYPFAPNGSFEFLGEGETALAADIHIALDGDSGDRNAKEVTQEVSQGESASGNSHDLFRFVGLGKDGRGEFESEGVILFPRKREVCTFHTLLYSSLDARQPES